MKPARLVPVGEAELHAYVDGQLPDDRRAAVEAWLAAHPEDAERVAAYGSLAQQWRAAYEPVLSEPMPRELAAVLLARPPSRLPRRAAIVAGLGVVALAAWVLFRPEHVPSAAAAEMVRRAAVAHAIYAAEVEHPVETRPGAKAQLLAWLSERLNMKVDAPDLGAVGLWFIGGRLLPGDKAAAALLMYEGQNGQRVTLYWGPEFRQARETGVQFARREPPRVYYWLDEECGYAVASADLSQHDLQRVARLAHDQLEK
jgi:anti-sigma factor RsiW